MKNLTTILFILLLLTYSFYAYATVKPELKSLYDGAHLVVEGKISSISQSPYTGVNTSPEPTQLVVVIDVMQVKKGVLKKSSVEFSYSDILGKGHIFKECIGKKNCTEFSKSKYIFFLLDQAKDIRYSKLGARGYILVDAWFGMEPL